ncbi:MAG: rRNA pseudouridine synthase [Candidatus Kuenenia sp.]|nr:rRNA pseudouridine synthase [Candidatus Kuenenia hertensis]
MQERLQKVLASAGIGSRRECENIILEGRVTVDGKRVTALGTIVDAEKNRIYCDGMLIKPECKIYYLLNKPKGYLCTNYDELNRLKAIDIIKNVKQRLYTIGRLDKQSEGLIIITNDGDLSNKLSHPRYAISKTYFVEIDGHLSNETMKALQSGVWLSFGKTQPVIIKNMHRGLKKSRFEMILYEGKNREIRRMLAEYGHKVRTLKRIKIGILSDQSLKVGKYRKLTDREIKSLYSMTEKNPIENKRGKQEYDTVTASQKK